MPKPKKCKICKEPFEPVRQLQPTCEKYECMVAYTEKHLQKRQKEKTKQHNKDRKAFNESDKSFLKRNAQMLINKYARLRDYNENGLRCVTCDSKTGKRDGGHFLPTSGYSAIRYNTNQIHQQCVKCNQYQGGMPKEYRLFMIEKYGTEYVENLEAQKGVLRSYDVAYYQKLIRVVRKKIKKLEQRM